MVQLGQVVDIREHQAAIQKVSRVVEAVAGLASKLRGFLNKISHPQFMPYHADL
jgi:hypothetical protein